jgi:hypothetical protein
MKENVINVDQYRLAIITALPKEFAAVEAMLDQYEDIIIPADPGRYTVGVIGSHPVVVTLLPKMGTNLATAISSHLLRSFPKINDILMVGIAGGVPDPKNAENHVRLGDIVVSMDRGVIQFDLGKLEQIVHEDHHTGGSLSETQTLLHQLVSNKQRNCWKHEDSAKNIHGSNILPELLFLKTQRGRQVREIFCTTQLIQVRLFLIQKILRVARKSQSFIMV